MKKIILASLLLVLFIAPCLPSTAHELTAVSSKLPKKVEAALNSYIGGIQSSISQWGGFGAAQIIEQGRTNHGDYYFYYTIWVDPSSGIYLYPQGNYYIEIKPNGEIVQATQVYIIMSN